MKGLLRCAPRPRPTACGNGGFAASLSRKRGPIEIHGVFRSGDPKILINNTTDTIVYYRKAKLWSFISFLSPCVNIKIVFTILLGVIFVYILFGNCKFLIRLITFAVPPLLSHSILSLHAEPLHSGMFAIIDC